MIDESDIRDLAKSIMSTTMQTVSAGRSTVISPTEVRNITKEIITEAESGSISGFERALSRAEKILDKLNVNIRDFDESLSNRIDELKEQKKTSEKEVQELRAENIAAETRAQKDGIEFAYQTRILTTNEIKNRKSLLDQRKKLFEEEEKKVLQTRKEIISQEKPLTLEQQKIIIEDKKRLDDEKEKILAEERTLTPLTDDGDTKFSGPTSSFYEELKAPFVAVGDAFLSIRDLGNDLVKVFKFFSEDGLTKGLAMFKKGIMFIGKIIFSKAMLIGVAIGAVVGAVVYFKDQLLSIGKFIIGIPGMIMDGFKTVFTMITDFYKTMINAVISLINKIPGVNIPLLETSQMKQQVTDSQTADMGYRETPLYDDMGDQRPVFEQNTPSTLIANRQVNGNALNMRGFNTDRTSVALANESNRNIMENNMPPVIVNNSNASNVQSVGQTSIGFVENKNVDETFINLNEAVA